jgi:ABC-type Mn2+/Zn2+ transport system permease subunit
MIDLLKEIFDPQFLLRNSVYISVLIGLVCPLIGVYLVLRRLIFMAVALPQVSSCGIAFAFALHSWHLIPHLEEQSENGLAFAGAGIFTLGAILLLAFPDRKRREVEGRIGSFYVLAGAWSILLLLKNPYGEHGLLDRLRGEIIAVTNIELVFTAAAFLIVTICLLLFQKELLLVSLDRDMALSLRKRVALWDGLLFTIIGLTVSLAVLSVGPLVSFGFLILPPLTAKNFTRTMPQFALWSSLIGGISALAGFCIAYRWDLPVGPTDVALLGMIYALSVPARVLILRRAH